MRQSDSALGSDSATQEFPRARLTSSDRTFSQTIADWEASDHANLHASKDVHGWSLLLLAYSAVGIIFGDLATSPLYVYPSIFDAPPSREDAMGSLSLIIWTLTSIGLIKYVGIVLHANDNGEGGTISLYSLLCREISVGFGYRATATDRKSLSAMSRPQALPALARMSMAFGQRPAVAPRVSPLPTIHQTVRKSALRRALEGSQQLKRLLFVGVLLGTCMVIGDGILTPAISVLSAVEGLRIAVPEMQQGTIIAITVAILIALFSMQRHGTAKVGIFFAPILLMWLLSIATIGVYNTIKWDPGVLAAVLPTHAFRFFTRNKWLGWQRLGGVLLCITGTEALFADLGHFTITAIQLSFACVAYPCVLLQYFGQTAYIIAHPQDVSSAFWSAVPEPVFWPLLVIGTLAAIVASQAMITGVFSIVNQLMSLGCIPRVKVVHTSPDIYGQIFVPEINNMIMVLAVAVVIGFRDSVHLGNAYGLAVTVDMMVTTCLVTMVMLLVWKTPVVLALLFFLTFGTIEGALFSATLLKVPHGGWFPLVVAVLFSSVMYVWHWGNRLKGQYGVTRHVPLEHFFAPGEEPLRLLWKPDPIARVPGIGFYFSEHKNGLPPVLQHFLSNVPALHDVVVLITIRHVPVATVLPEERLLIKPLSDFPGFFRAIARFGYKDVTDVGDQFAADVVNAIYRVFHYDPSNRSAHGGKEAEASKVTANGDAGSLTRNHCGGYVMPGTSQPSPAAGTLSLLARISLGRPSAQGARNSLQAELGCSAADSPCAVDSGGYDERDMTDK
ncbi:hypothetical protein WJX73_001487 [Symbiochloris irregularis]|uniref:Potassium transporter n=1 Tax=Symbiochloris irregularis TaxID=706552 RepID=A0AAW1P8A2_9CHLO